MEYHRTIERSFPVGDHPSLRIANRAGELVVMGEDRADIAFTARITVQAQGELDGERRLDAISLPMTQEGDRVEIGPPQSEDADAGGVTIFGLGIHVGVFAGLGARVDMHVRVPRACALEAEQRAGPLRVTGLRAGLRASNRSGRTEVRDVHGDTTVEGRSGSVEVREIAGPLSLEVRSGKLEVDDVQGDVTLSSRSGPVSVRRVRGRLTLRGRSGRVRLENVDGPLELATAAGAVEVRGRIAHPAAIDVQSGSVRLAVTRDSAFFLDAESRTGSVRSDLPVDHLDGPPPPEAPTVRVRTQAGSIRVVPA